MMGALTFSPFFAAVSYTHLAFIAHLIVKANKSIAKEYALGNNMSNSAKSA